MRKPEFFIVCPTGLSKARPGDAKYHVPIIRGEKAHSSVEPFSVFDAAQRYFNHALGYFRSRAPLGSPLTAAQQCRRLTDEE
jgi:hypothetical protein